MSCRNEGESEENQRPAFTASRSSMLSMGSSIVCLVSDLLVENCLRCDQRVSEGMCLRFVVRCVFVEKRLNAYACVRMMQVVHKMLLFLLQMCKKALVMRGIHQLFDA